MTNSTCASATVRFDWTWSKKRGWDEALGRVGQVGAREQMVWAGGAGPRIRRSVSQKATTVAADNIEKPIRKNKGRGGDKNFLYCGDWRETWPSSFGSPSSRGILAAKEGTVRHHDGGFRESKKGCWTPKLALAVGWETGVPTRRRELLGNVGCGTPARRAGRGAGPAASARVPVV